MSNKIKHSNLDLYELIQSLSKSEKIYFKRYSGFHVKGEGNQSVLLFDALAQQAQFDFEKAVKIAGINPAQSRNIKMYLYEQIMKSLEQYHADNTIDDQLKRLLRQVEILYNKSLFSHAGVMIRKGQELAVRYEKYLAQLELNIWMKRLLEINSFADNNLDDLQKIISENRIIIERIEEEEKAWHWNASVYWMATKKGIAGNPESREFLSGILVQPLMQKPDRAKSFQSKASLLSAKANYFSQKGDWKNVLKYRKAIVELFESKPEMIGANTQLYLGAVYNVLVAIFNLRQFDAEAFRFIEKIREAPARYYPRNNAPENIRVRVFSYANAIELAIYANTGQWKKALEKIEQVEEGFQRYEGKMNRFLKLVMTYNIAYIYFANDDLAKSDYWTDIMMNDTEATTGDQYYIQARIFKMLVQFELGNYFLFDYMTKSTRRYLLQRRHQFEYEACLIRFFKQFNRKEFNENTLREAFVGLKDEIQKIQKDPKEKLAMNFFDFVCWCESHIHQAPYSVLFETKAVR